jgi:hypothetical protein
MSFITVSKRKISLTYVCKILWNSDYLSTFAYVSFPTSESGTTLSNRFNLSYLLRQNRTFGTVPTEKKIHQLPVLVWGVPHKGTTGPCGYHHRVIIITEETVFTIPPICLIDVGRTGSELGATVLRTSNNVSL